MMIVLLAYDGLRSTYENAWIIGFIIGLLIALGIARLITWVIRLILSKTIMRGQKKRAAFTAFALCSVVIVTLIFVTRAGQPEYQDRVVDRYSGGYTVERTELFSPLTASLVYVGMLLLWLMVDLKLADRDYAKEISIFDRAADEKPAGLRMAADAASLNLAAHPGPEPQSMAHQPPQRQ